MKRYWHVISFFMAVSILISCRGGETRPPDSGVNQKSSQPEIEKVFLEAGIPLLKQKVSPRDFSLPLVTSSPVMGRTQSLSSLKGKVVFLNFWATWCPPCREEMPSMEALYKGYREKGLEILAVNSGENQQEVLSFLSNKEFSFTVVLDSDSKTSRAYGIQAFPTSFIIDREGNIVARVVGSMNWDVPNIRAALEMLLN